MKPARLSRVAAVAHQRRCGARTKAGRTCVSSVVPGKKRCPVHGGLSPGAPKGSDNGNYKNGEWTAEAIEERQWLRSLIRDFAGGKDGGL
jgi:hypothetical protein